MRVFYVDESEESLKSTRRYFVKLDNTTPPDEFKGWLAIDATTPQDLLQKAAELYNFINVQNVSIQIWSSSQPNSKRLDTLDEIPKENEFVWVKCVPIKKDIKLD